MLSFGIIVVGISFVWAGCYLYLIYKKQQSNKSTHPQPPVEIHPLDIILNEEGWKIIKSVEPSKFEMKDLELVSFKQWNRDPLPGEVMRQSAVSLNANLGLDDAKRVFDQQKEIPVAFRSYCLVFSGTLLIGPGDAMGVMCLTCAYDGWKPLVVYLNLTRFDGDSYYLVRIKSAA